MRYFEENQVVRAFTVAEYRRQSELSAPVVLILPQPQEIEELESDLCFCLDESKVFRFQPWEVLPFDPLSPAVEISASRIHCLQQLVASKAGLVITSIQALLQRVPSRDRLLSSRLTLSKQLRISSEKLTLFFEYAGYTRSTLVEDVGQYAVRGAVRGVCI